MTSESTCFIREWEKQTLQFENNYNLFKSLNNSFRTRQKKTHGEYVFNVYVYILLRHACAYAVSRLPAYDNNTLLNKQKRAVIWIQIFIFMFKFLLDGPPWIWAHQTGDSRLTVPQKTISKSINRWLYRDRKRRIDRVQKRTRIYVRRLNRGAHGSAVPLSIRFVCTDFKWI